MALISLRDVSVSFGGPPVLEHLTLHIEAGERVCLLGRNGEGKSTLMRLISGDLSPDTGDVLRQQGLRIGHLPQEVPQDLQGTVIDIVCSAADNAASAHADGLWQPRQDAESALTQLQLDANADFTELSGGLKRRVLLARALSSHPDLLVLDEPTNHLDIDSINWLETHLLRRTSSLLFVTHDRMLLRKLATRIIELDRGQLADWACDYDTFLKRKQALLDAEAQQWGQFDKKLAQEEAWIRQGIRARRTRNEGRVRALMQMRAQRQNRREQPGAVRMQAQEAERSGKLVIEAQNISFSYDDQPLIKNFSTTILRGDKVGILGPNGIGKTTLLRLLLNDLTPQEGRVRLGVRLEVAYFDQLRALIDDAKTVQENVAGGSDTIVLNGNPRHILSYLQDFLFTPDRARSPAGMLSGGERNRLLLARLFVQPSNVLVLDEPTNDLDAETLELLEELLLDYAGTLLLVSHDRAFLNNVVTSTLALEGNGRVREYVGGYDDWLRQRQPPPAAKVTKPAAAKAVNSQPPPERPRRLNYKERRELEALPEHIEMLEAEQAQLYEMLSDPKLYRQEGEEIAQLQARLAGIAQALEDAYIRWEQLEQLPR
ncbi:MAG TPA: ATP-binding cassette domain-containing protein [Candidatus Entotheonella sp.]